MYLALQKFLAALIFPLSVVLCIAVLAIFTLLWIPYIVILIIDKLFWWLFGKKLYKGIHAFEEFIFSCYGFAAMLVYIPFAAFYEKLY